MNKPTGLRLKLPLMALCLGVLAVWVALSLPCPIRSLTGVICPGCGMGRAWLAALRLDFGRAFHYHPLFWSVPVLALLVLYDCRPFRKQRLNLLVSLLLLGAVALCYGVRLIAFLHGDLSL